jgi:hypothetical protein
MDRSYDYCRKGKASAEAVWIQALYDEDAVAGDRCAATLLMDLAKAFECTPLHEIWRRGVLLKSPLRALRLVLELCSAPRHLTLQCAVVEESGVSLSAVLAGLTFTTDCMFLALASETDRWVHNYPAVASVFRVAAIVDDVSLQIVCDNSEVVSDAMLDLSETAMRDLRKLGCTVSAGPRWQPGGKTLVTTSCSTVRAQI